MVRRLAWLLVVVVTQQALSVPVLPSAFLETELEERTRGPSKTFKFFQRYASSVVKMSSMGLRTTVEYFEEKDKNKDEHSSDVDMSLLQVLQRLETPISMLELEFIVVTDDELAAEILLDKTGEVKDECAHFATLAQKTWADANPGGSPSANNLLQVEAKSEAPKFEPQILVSELVQTLNFSSTTEAHLLAVLQEASKDLDVEEAEASQTDSLQAISALELEVSTGFFILPGIAARIYQGLNTASWLCKIASTLLEKNPNNQLGTTLLQVAEGSPFDRDEMIEQDAREMGMTVDQAFAKMAKITSNKSLHLLNKETELKLLDDVTHIPFLSAAEKNMVDTLRDEIEHPNPPKISDPNSGSRQLVAAEPPEEVEARSPESNFIHTDHSAGQPLPIEKENASGFSLPNKADEVIQHAMGPPKSFDSKFLPDANIVAAEREAETRDREMKSMEHMSLEGVTDKYMPTIADESIDNGMWSAKGSDNSLQAFEDSVERAATKSGLVQTQTGVKGASAASQETAAFIERGILQTARGWWYAFKAYVQMSKALAKTKEHGGE